MLRLAAMFGKLAGRRTVAAASALAAGWRPARRRAARPASGDLGKGLTAVAGLTVGHHTLTERPTGCTVILTGADGVVAGVDVRGGAPGTRDIELLNPSNSVQRVHAIVLSGGSAFGLDAASGVMRYLDERKIGFKIANTQVPIVPAAILMDLGFGGKPEVRPGPDCGYRAAAAATADAVAEGNVGAGAGATVGKLGEPRRPMKAGIGSAALVLPDGLVVAALVAVNAVGDVIDPATGKVIAGVRTADGKGLADARALLRSGADVHGAPRREHHARRRRHQRHPDQGPGAQGGADGARRLRPRHLADPHAGRRRHDLHARHRRAAGRARHPAHRRARRRGDERGDRPRRAQRQGVRRPARGPRSAAGAPALTASR